MAFLPFKEDSIYKSFQLLLVHDFLLIWRFKFKKKINVLSDVFISYPISRIKSIAGAKSTVFFLDQKKEK